MLKYIYILALVLMNSYSLAQDYSKKVIGSWVKIDVAYNSGKSLSAEHPLNNVYARFVFKENGKAFKTSAPLENGYLFDYSVSDKIISIGFIKYEIERLSNDTLILVEANGDVFDDKSFRYTFIAESAYVHGIELGSDMLIKHLDENIIIENEKVRAFFDADQSFHDFLTQSIEDYSSVSSGKGFFMATFIVNEKGKLENIQIHKGFGEPFDSQFIQAVKSSSKYWRPAVCNGENAKIIHIETYTFNDFKETYSGYIDGVMLIKQEKYQEALDSFDGYLKKKPNDSDAIYQKGLVYYKLGQIAKACEYWQQLDILKSSNARKLIKKTCE